MEPRRCRRGDYAILGIRTFDGELQWSRDVAAAVTISGVEAAVALLRASMEPRRCRRGDKSADCASCRRRLLQWSRDVAAAVTEEFYVHNLDPTKLQWSRDVAAAVTPRYAKLDSTRLFSAHFERLSHGSPG